MHINDLFIKYASDKAQHGYGEFYANHLPDSPKRILEIGVKNGASLAAWAEYFPNAEIHGLDLFAEIASDKVILDIDIMTNGKFSLGRFALHQGNQCDWRVLEQLRKLDFDVIIDDGSHNSRDQMMTFFGLFNGKHYFIEDLHCNNDQFFSQGLPQEFSASVLFADVAIACGGTVYRDCIKFNDDLFADPRKIVCIKNK